MVYRIGAVPLLSVLLCAPLFGDEPALAPREGVLLLKNGHVMQGGITKAGDYFVLTLGKTTEVRLPAADVETQCVDLDDAYHYQAALLSGKKADPHLTLAEWCLRNRLLQPAEDQVNFARQLEPENPRVKQLELRLKTTAEAPAPSGARRAASATVSSRQLDETLEKLPKGSVEKFSAAIQPMLINRCGANGCHGPAAKSNFHLLRPAAGQMMTKRFTQRNLFTVLKYMDQDQPTESPLVTIPQERHGGTQSPVFDKRSQHQLDDLIAWAKHLAPKPPQASHPSSVGPMQTLLSQSNSASDKPAAESTGGKAPPNTSPPGEKGEARRPRAPRLPPATDAKDESNKREDFTPRDPFDPEIFNRKHLPGKT